MTGDRQGFTTARPGPHHSCHCTSYQPAGYPAPTDFTTAADLLKEWKAKLCQRCDQYFTARCSLGRSPGIHPEEQVPVCSLFHGIGMPWEVGE